MGCPSKERARPRGATLHDTDIKDAVKKTTRKTKEGGKPEAKNLSSRGLAGGVESLQAFFLGTGGLIEGSRENARNRRDVTPFRNPKGGGVITSVPAAIRKLRQIVPRVSRQPPGLKKREGSDHER